MEPAQWSDDIVYENYVEREVQEFEEHEREYVRAFRGMMRLSCFTYTLQLVVAKFNTSKQVSAILNRVFAVVSKFNKSKNATERLEKECGGIMPYKVVLHISSNRKTSKRE